MEDLKGGDAALNAQILRDVFGGAKGPVADALNLNAGYALAACEVSLCASVGAAMSPLEAEEACAGGRMHIVCHHTPWLLQHRRLAAALPLLARETQPFHMCRWRPLHQRVS